MTEMDASEHELKVLENIYSRSDHVRQRDLARIAGLSLGMTNAIVKRLVQKGWLTIRKVNNRNIRYAVSSEGIEQITRRSYRYFKRTIKNVVYYREAIEQFVHEVKGRGFRVVVLVGSSDLDFIVEHACGAYGIAYQTEEEPDQGSSRVRLDAEEGKFLLFSESYAEDPREPTRAPNVAILQEVVSRSIGERQESASAI